MIAQSTDLGRKVETRRWGTGAEPACWEGEGRHPPACARVEGFPPLEVAEPAVRACVAVEGARAAAMQVSNLKLSLAVSRDEEFVRVAIVEPWVRELGGHAHHYLLLTLARRRLADAAAGLPDSACGWICIDDFRHDPMMAPPRLNTDVFRIRRQLAAHGVTDADSIIERRKLTRELRIGTSRLSIGSL